MQEKVRNINEMKEGRDSSGRFVKGVSGNPRGMPKLVGGIRELAQSKCPEAIEELIAIMLNPKERTDHRIRAAEIILDRGLGRPEQAVRAEVRQIRDVADLGDGEIAALLVAAGVAPEEGRSDITDPVH